MLNAYHICNCNIIFIPIINEQMTKEEAIVQMKKGKKITHRYFTSDEWMTIENGMYLLEDGVRVSEKEFWHYRQQDSWKDGYEFFSE